jgi:hypothetical protein
MIKSAFIYEDGYENVYNEKGERFFDLMEDVLTEISDPNVILDNITSQKSYLRISNLQRKKLQQKIR